MYSIIGRTRCSRNWEEVKLTRISFRRWLHCSVFSIFQSLFFSCQFFLFLSPPCSDLFSILSASGPNLLLILKISILILTIFCFKISSKRASSIIIISWAIFFLGVRKIASFNLRFLFSLSLSCSQSLVLYLFQHHNFINYERYFFCRESEWASYCLFSGPVEGTLFWRKDAWKLNTF